MIIDLIHMKAGESGVIAELQGGHVLIRRLESMGVRRGKKIRKVSSHFWRGPQTIEVNNIRVAIGFGMARKILIKVER